MKTKLNIVVLSYGDVYLHLYFAHTASDYNVKAADINIILKTALCGNDGNALYEIPGFQLFRNDFMQHGATRGSAV